MSLCSAVDLVSLNVGELEEDIPGMMDRSFQTNSGPKELGIHVVCGLLMRVLGKSLNLCGEGWAFSARLHVTWLKIRWMGGGSHSFP